MHKKKKSECVNTGFVHKFHWWWDHTAVTLILVHKCFLHQGFLNSNQAPPFINLKLFTKHHKHAVAFVLYYFAFCRVISVFQLKNTVSYNSYTCCSNTQMPISTRRASVSFTAPEHFPNALAVNCRPGLNPANLNSRQMFSASIRSPPRSL